MTLAQLFHKHSLRTKQCHQPVIKPNNLRSADVLVGTANEKANEKAVNDGRLTFENPSPVPVP